MPNAVNITFSDDALEELHQRIIAPKRAGPIQPTVGDYYALQADALLLYDHTMTMRRFVKKQLGIKE